MNFPTIMFASLNGQSLDPKTQPYLTAANILPGQVYPGSAATDYPINSERVIYAVNNLFVSLRSAGLLSQIKYMYPIWGFTQGNNFVNAMNPGTKDLVAISPFGATFNRQGIISDHASNINTGIFLSEFGEYNYSAGVYLQPQGGGGNTFGTTSSVDGRYQWGMTTPTAFFKSFSFKGIAASGGFQSGLHIINTTAVNRNTYYIKGVQVALDTTTSVAGVNSADFRSIWLGQLNYADTYQSGASSGENTGFFFVSSGLSDADSVTMSAIVEKFMWELHRDVGENVYNAYQGLGDSIMWGALADPIYFAWYNNVCYQKDATVLNYAVPGTTIVDCNTTAINSLLPKDAKHTKVFIAYSTNDFIHDIQSGGVAMNLTLFASTYATVLGKILAQGYLPSDICVITGYYVNAEAVQTGASAVQDNYIAEAATAAANAGITNVFNLKPVMIAAGGNSIISGLHPINTGMTVIANYIIANIVGF